MVETQPGDLFTYKGTTYLVEDRARWFCGLVPTGHIVEGPNHGVRVILVYSNYRVGGF